VYVSHFSENQPTFGVLVEPSNPPCWTLRIDARVESYGRQGRSVAKPFSYFIKSLVVQLGDGQETDQLVEWIKGPLTETDGFEIRRVGSVDVPVRILLRLDYQPERFRVSTALAEVVDLELATRPQIVLAIWQYIKLHKLQESDEKKVVNNDATLQGLFGCDKMTFTEIPARLDPHLMPPEPIELDYLVGVGRMEGSAIWDIDVEIDDPSKPRPMSANLVAQQREIALLDQKINEVTTALKASVAHERVLRQFSEQPVQCIRRLMEAQCADQEAVLGEPAITVDDLAHASNFDTEEIERAVSLFTSYTNDPFRF
jgi:SWI/SNF-related matrix-associated actin-dependent regulator of chromatin subfamily D